MIGSRGAPKGIFERETVVEGSNAEKSDAVNGTLLAS